MCILGSFLTKSKKLHITTIQIKVLEILDTFLLIMVCRPQNYHLFKQDLFIYLLTNLALQSSMVITFHILQMSIEFRHFSAGRISAAPKSTLCSSSPCKRKKKLEVKLFSHFAGYAKSIL